jgi:lytic murein transglycosylase
MLSNPVELLARRRRLHAAAAVLLLTLAGCASAPPATAPPTTAPSTTPPAVAASAPASGPDAAQQEAARAEAETAARFAQWVADFRVQALAAGIRADTFDAAFDGVQLRRHAVTQDRSQPEFVRAIWDYVDGVITPQRVANGQARLQDLQAQADEVARQYGVPGPVLMAVWGIESNYGSNYGDVPVIDALATLGFEGRRDRWARSELIDALKILQGGDIDRAHMIGSWAGAMGQTQFMPSSFLAYAVDGDGDGHRDIWGSMPDVLASTANFLARKGWRPDEPWGLEVQLPAGFDPEQADPDVRQSSAQWAEAGVRSMDGSALPALADAAVLLPAGVRGPAFLVGQNYRVILRYNNAMSYALTVGLLSQRIAGGPGVQAPWPRDLRALTRGEVIALQTGLNAQGFDCGTPDGQFGPASRKALRQYQRHIGVPADGFPTEDLLRRLQPAP